MSYLQSEITIYSDKCEKFEEKKNIDVKTEVVKHVKKVRKNDIHTFSATSRTPD